MNADNLYVFPNSYLCLDKASLVFDRLNVLGWPLLSICFYICGIACFLGGFVLLVKDGANNAVAEL